MKLTLSLAAVAAAFVALLVTPCSAAPKAAFPPQHWSSMTLTAKLAIVRQDIHRDRTAVAWWLHQARRFPDGVTRRFHRCPALGIRLPGMICLHGQRLVKELKLQTKIERALTPKPTIAHLALWECIHGGEGAWYDNTGNHYYNGLQMTWGWGPLPDSGPLADPNHYTPMQIMAVAEGAYREHGYSRAWLGGQWPQTSPPCLRFA